MIKNPYIYTGPLDPISNKLVCISRNKDVNDIIESIEEGHYYAVLGPRQIGKTTFLRQIQNHIKNAFQILFNL